MPDETSFSGPYVQAAVLCEKLLIEAGNLPSFIRVIDRFTVPKLNALQPGIQVFEQPLQFTLVVMLKSGDLGSGRHEVKIRFRKPDHTYGPDVTTSAFFSGGEDNGAMLAMPVVMPAPLEGLYWFEVVFEGAGVITQIAMRGVYQPTDASNLPHPISGGPR